MPHAEGIHSFERLQAVVEAERRGGRQRRGLGSVGGGERRREWETTRGPAQRGRGLRMPGRRVVWPYFLVRRFDT
ncbi:hypothetical protein E2562_035785 [Oryza meyeriana var. granulata]|uniref:Uncharacterized protein n=1 Tax=Oryza meyeriana var. granulata TaxID=110450 RepID=A0A6G1CM51_9ORYZ|nr:hypothetical protein E2562_035785 [Oryza meyeriana var. granulata]